MDKLIKTIELTPIDGRKSFGGKAKAIQSGNTIQLMSYNTIVAEYNIPKDEFKIFGLHSATTLRHLKAFAVYIDKGHMNKAELSEYLN